MHIRKAAEKDYNRILEIYATARQFMRDHGNPNQWYDHKPDPADVKADIRDGVSFLCVQEGKIIGVMRLTSEDDPTYGFIDGEWLSNTPYAVVHRIASSGEVKGTGEFMLRYAMENHKHIRIDTHKDNYVMQRLLEKLGFTHCGVIYLADGAPREAYETVGIRLYT